ncbi:PREDICTED: properdin-like [Thamnophis sirtalis]|uniref:Properdin-like n=1 Tax=Thamnophis sirtalis TaxID=35019 RepID=A0A6I9YNZ8_9SAUR|nr:PREDICTED: properdin-like [Thamnophis sirtalis]
MKTLGRKSLQFLVIVCWFFASLESPAEAENVLCYKTFDEISGTCNNLLGDEVAQEDCCLNHEYGFQSTEQGPCQSCREAKWSQWTSWSACSVSCTEGVQRRSRVCYGLPSEPMECPSGRREREMKSCLLKECCPIFFHVFLFNAAHGNWGNWGPWQHCSHTCSVEGSASQPQQQRTRPCNNPPPSSSPPGNPCPGASRESQTCTGLPFCPRDGNWGSWKPSQPCSVTCGVGQVVQNRQCDNPPPKYGGRACLGAAERRQPCTIKVPCPVNGHWSEWGAWQECTRHEIGFEIKCEEIPAIQRRTRKCIGYRNGGSRCSLSGRESRVCYHFDGCSVTGQWTTWSSWGLCEPACGPEPKKSRKRVCQAIYPNFPKVVVGENQKEQNVTFWGKPKPQCKQLEGQSLEVVEETPCRNVPPCED